MRLEDQLLEDKLSKLNFKCVHTRRDGYCLLYSLYAMLDLDSRFDGSFDDFVRQLHGPVRTFIETDMVSFFPHISRAQAWQQWIKFLSTGDYNCEIVDALPPIISNVFNVRVILIRQEPGGLHTITLNDEVKV